MRRHIALYGTVQGVGFRFFARQAARRLDLAGHVSNRADGAVEIEVEGSSDAVTSFIHTVENGPPLARVERIEDLPPTTGTLRPPFEIR